MRGIEGIIAMLGGIVSRALGAAALGAAALGGALTAGTAHAATTTSYYPYADLYQVHSDGSIWHYTGTPFSGWTEIADNSATMQVVTSDDGAHVYELDNTGTIWSYQGTPISGWIKIDDGNTAPATARTQIAAIGGEVYRVFADGQVWRYTGTPVTGWTQVNQDTALAGITTTSTNLYELDKTGVIHMLTGGTWTTLDDNPAAVGIAGNDENGSVFELHKDGTIWRYTGTPITGWTEIGNNPAAVRIVADPTPGTVYELDSTGTIWRFTLPGGWVKVDDNQATGGITVGDGGNLYQWQNKGIYTGDIWAFTGVPVTGWTELDYNPLATAAVAGGTRSFD